MRIVYALVLIAGLAAVVADHLASPSSRAGGLAGGFRRRLRALRRAVPVDAEKIARFSDGKPISALLKMPGGSKFPRGARRHAVAGHPLPISLRSFT